MSTNTTAARRVANTIRGFKWILIAAQVIVGIVVLLALNSAESLPPSTAVLGPLALIAMLLSALTTWVLYGWFEHTLRLLAGIAEATRNETDSVLMSPLPAVASDPR